MERGERSSLGANSRIVACLTALYLFAKSRPQLLVEHVQTLQPYLQILCECPGDHMVRAKHSSCDYNSVSLRLCHRDTE